MALARRMFSISARLQRTKITLRQIPHSRFVACALLLLASSSVSGCVGFSSLLGTEESAQQFAYYQAGRGGLVSDKETALEYWGEPAARVSLAPDGSEAWTYRGGVAWRGVAIWVVVPIPLVVPVGHNEVTMQFSASGDLVSGRAEQAAEKGFVCWILLFECNPDDQL